MKEIPAFLRDTDLDASRLENLVLNRRTVLKGLLAGMGLGLGADRLLAAPPQPRAGTATATAAAAEDLPWDTMAAVQAQLFPSEPDAPGAQDVNALGFLKSAIYGADADPDERNFLLAGLKWLDGSTRAHDQRAFADLTSGEREKLLRHMTESKDGESWIAVVLYYVLEALLSDPVYGGNTNAVGWKWLDYVPGFPRPPVGKRYYELAER